ncbi:glucose-6-phosphate isomerase [Candidatus Halobeggiatoa sp. HSG11]|nr:glucose-6-phosphate isomerase [Candidatus Halobeggiatoa sp. HSG11]
MNNLISHSHIWATLKNHQKYLAPVQMQDLFALDEHRYENFSIEACNLLLDYSKNRLTKDTLHLLEQLAIKVKLEDWIKKLFNGELVNNTEHRAALHIALRNRSNTKISVNNKDIMPDVNKVLAKMRDFSNIVRDGKWLGYTGKPINTIVNIGIGGSDLGPAMVNRALRVYQHPSLQSHFVSNVDNSHLDDILQKINPETTLFIVASKTFTTQETLLNAQTARNWLIDKLGDDAAVAKHFVAVSTATQKVVEFGIDPANMFGFWDWVGGRYSLWSAIGLPIIVMIGMDQFEELLTGAHKLDQHFATAPLLENMPVLMGLIDVWYSSFFGTTSQAVLPYDYTLKLFPAYLQQLVMESLGKHVTRDGNSVDYATCPVVWGAPGNNGQHAFYQLLHQGTHIIPTDFIVAIESNKENNDNLSSAEHQNAVLSNALAQSHVLMMGRNLEKTKQSLIDMGIQGSDLTQQLPHRVFPGNQPSNTIVYKKLTPQVLGTLIALYEHKVFVQSVCWDINPFDQWGVELGKNVANTLLSELQTENNNTHDSSTNGLLNYIKVNRRDML